MNEVTLYSDDVYYVCIRTDQNNPSLAAPLLYFVNIRASDLHGCLLQGNSMGLLITCLYKGGGS